MIPERRQAAGWVLLAAIVAFLANVLRLRAARTKGPQGTRPDADHGRVPHDASASGDLPAPRPPATDDVSTADNLSATADVSAVDHLATTGDQSVPHSLSATEEVSAVDTVSTTGDPSATDDLSTTNDGSAPGDVSAGADVPVELDRQVSELDPDGLDPAVLDPDGAHPIAAGRDARPVESGADLADLRARLFGTAGPPGPQDAVTERHQATDGRQAVGSGSVVGGRGWWRTSRRRLAILLLAFAVAAATAATAWAYWGGITTPGGNGAANAASVNQAPTPTAVVGVAQAVAVSWPAGTMTNTQAVSGYVVKRYDAATSVVQTTGTGCAGTITALTCTEAGVPMGNWKYSVTPLIGTNWQGAESLKSAQVGVGASVLTLARTDFGAPLPATTTGTLTGFGANEGLTYRLDAGTALTGSPATTGAGGAATITALTIPAGTSEGDHTVYAVGAGGSLASFSITVDLTAPTAAAALSPAANGAGWNNTSPVSVTLTGADGAGSGINQIRYTVDGSDPVSSGTVVVYSAPIPVAATATVRYYATDDAGNSSAVQNKNVNIDTVAPVNALTLSNVTGNAVKSGNTIYYRGAATGSFTVTNTLTDSGGSGAASSGTATLSGTSTGFTHTSSTVTTPTGGPYVSATFSWTAGATTSPTETVTGTDTAGNTVTTQLTLVNDSTGPGGVTVDATGLLGTGSRYSTSTTLSIATTKDGTAVTGAQLSRATATLTSPGTTNGVCGTFSGYTLITGGTDPASPKADTVTDQACYRYQYVVSDNVGNTTTQTSGDIKVDTTAPSAPTLAFSALTNAYPVGMTVYYRSAATGSFTTTALGADLASGIASYAFPTLGTGWTSTPGATGVNTYSWTASPTAPGAKNITATGNNTLTSTATAFTPTVDGSAPTGGSASHVNGYTTGLAVTVTFTGATADTGSGINPTSGRLKRTSTPLVNDVCVGATTTVNVENPTSPYTDSTVTSGNCYDYQYIMSDNVGNTAFWHSGSVAKVGYAGAVAADASLLSYWRLGESSGTVMADSKGTNTGSYANGPALGTAGAITGDTNTAVTYDGTDDYSQALATTGIPIGAAPRSVEMWFKTTSVARQTLFEYGSFGDTQEFGLYLRANNNDIVAWGFGGAGKDITFPLATPVTDGAWHHVVNTYDGTTLAVYIDGVLLGAEATVRNTVMDVDGSFGIGAALPLTGNGNSGGYFNGSLDEVSLYSTVLGAQKIADHFNLARSTDALGPAGGAVDAVGLVGTGSRYSTSTSLSIGFSKGADSAGVAATGATLTRATATLSSAGTANATCGTFGSYATLTGGTDPSSPFADTVTAQACYRYRYMVTDTRGNATTYTSGDIKVDTTASSTPTLAFSGFSNTFWSGSGSTVFYRSGASTGAFTATASSVDSNSGIASYAFPSLGTNWTSTAGVTGVNTYSWSGAPAVPGAKTVNATNNAGLASATATFTPTADGTAPAGGSVSYLNGNTTGTSVAVTFATGTDGGSGLNTAASVLQRARAPLTNGVCGTYDTFATIAANPTSPYTDTAVSGGFCYQYQYLAFDNVGNPATYTSASVSKLDYAAAVAATAGGVGHWRLGESTVSDDTFTGTAGVSVTSRTGEVGATWNQWQGTVAAVLSNEGRLRRDATTGSSHLSSAVPPTADYQVSADVHVKSLLTDDYAGVMGRLDTASNVTNGTRYLARYNVNSTRWELNRDASVNATLGTSVATLVAGQTYRLTLDMVGTRIRLLVNGVELIAATDAAPITGIGRAGIRLAQNSASVAVPSNTAGLHLDNYRVTPMTVKDSKGTNDGTYVNNPTLGAAGALAGDTDTAVTLNGTTHHMSIPHATALNVGDNFSFEAWVKRADNDPVVQTIAHKSGAFHLVFLDNKFAFFRDGAELISTATITPTDTTTFHHYVATKNGNAVKLYIDGVDVTGTPAVATIANSTNPLSLGAKFATSASEFLKGTLDEVALYGGVLSAATVADHYNLGRSDVSGPTGGSVDAIGLIGTASRYSTTTSLSIALAKGTDTRSGLAFAGAQLRRSTATLTAGTCGTYNTSVQVGADDPTSPVADTVPAGQACYRYEYVVADGVGNTTTYLSGDIKVDTTAPSAPALGFTSLTNAYWPGTGTTVYYRPAATTGSFTATATATDTNSGIAGYTMPTLGTGWTTPSGTTGVQTYAWSAANPTAPVGTQNATATNNATLTSTAGGFTLTTDATGPAAGTVSYTNGTYYTASVAVSFTAGASDTGSGVNPNAGLLQRQSAPVTSGTCGTFGIFTTLTGGTNPTSPFTDTSVVAGNCYRYQYVTTDRVGNETAATNTNTVRYINYAATVSATTGLVSQWRLDENSVSADTFTNATNGTVLSSHTGETDATWTRWAGDTITAFTTTTSPGTLRKSNVAGGVTYYASAVPPSADYQVEADVVVKSTAVASIGVVGRLSTSATGGGTYYLARYDKVTAAWQLLKVVNGTATVLGTAYAQTLAVGTYRLKLTLKGTSLALAVDGVDRVTATDAAIAAAGQAGVRLGAGSESTSYSDTTSYHLDNFRVTPPVTDSKGTNHGTYVAEPALGSPGALAGDANTAVTFNGTDEYATVARQVQDDYSVEFWFKSTQGLGTGTRWSDGAGLVDSETAGTWDEFGVSLRADGRIMAGTGRYGNGIYSISSAAGGYNDGAWHHVVFTRNRTTTAMVIYADGVAVATGNGATTSSTTTQTINFGRLASGTNYFAGSLDEIAVYNTALSAQTVADHFNQGSADVAGPTGGSVDATGLVGTGARYSTSTNLSIALAKGTDGGSGLAATGAQLRRSTATLTSAGTADGTCGTYNTSVQVGANDPTGPVADTVPAGQACYRYEYIVADTLGNTTTYFSGDIKVDTTTPTAPAFTFTAMTNTYWPGTGTTVYYRRAATSGSFTANATATDANSGIAGYAMPTLGTGWTTPSGTTGIQTYAWSSANPTAPVGGQSVTTTNNASLTSTAGFTLTTDATAPSGGSISYAGGFTSTGSVAVTFTAGGSDTGSGVNPTGGLLQRQSAILTSGTCGTFGSFATITGGTNPISPLSDTSVVAGNCYQYRYVTTDRVGNEDLTTVGANTVKATSYNAAVASTTGLVSQWRLGEATVASDTFTDATGALLSAHGGEIGTTTWTTVNSTRTAQVSATDTLRITSAGGNAVYYASAVPASADYMVEADVVLKGGLTSDDHIAGVVGRLDTAGTSTGTFYHARYNRLAAQWELRKTVNSAAVGNLTSATCSDFPQALTAGQSYRLGLDMKGSTIRMIVDGTVLCTATDSSITAKGRAGVRLYSATTPGDATGMHLDNFDVNHPVVDSYAANHGDYSYGPTLGVTGALAGDANTAATFNGSNEYATVTRQIQDDFSIEFWFKSTQGLSTSTNWWDGVGLVDAESAGNTNDFGVSLRSDGKVMAGVGKAGGDITIVSSGSGYNNNAWHHVVMTRTRSTGAFQLYLDGGLAGSATSSTLALTSSTSLTFGRINPGWNYYAGSLDEIAVYNTAISAATVNDHFNLAAPDTAGPTGGSVDATGLTGTGSRYSTSTTLNLTLAKGTDARSGLAATGAQLRRSTATLTTGVCGTYNASVQIGADDPALTVSDTVPTPQACYRYEYVVADTLGNTTTYLSGDIKVDTTAPTAPAFTFTAMTNAYWSGSGSTVYYRPTATSGSFTATATATDANSGIAGYTMPALGTGWSAPSGTTGVQAYSWSAANPTAPTGTQNASATNNATLGSTGGFTVVADNITPTAGSITYTDGAYANASVSISFTSGTDAGSGLDAAGRLLQRASATNPGGTCGTLGGFTTIATNPTSPYTDTTVLSGNCYQYRYVTADQVGNEWINTSASVVRLNANNYGPTVLATTGLTGYYRLGEASGTTMVDSAPTPNNGTYSGVTLGATGGLLNDTNTAATFNGTTSHALVARQIADDFSIEFRFKSTQNPSTGTRWWDGVGLVDGEVSGATNDFGVGLHGGGKLAAGTGTLGGSDATIITSTGGYNDGQWHHVVFTRVKTGGAMKIYVDGVLRASGTGGVNSLTASTNLYVGRLAGGSVGDYFAGTMDEVALYTTALDGDTVLDHYNEGSNYMPPTMTWNFEESSGTTVADSSGYSPSNPGTASWSTGWDATGHTGRAINFNNSLTYYVAGTNQPIDTSEPFTVSAWVNLSSTGTAVKAVFSQGPETGASTYSSLILKYGSNGKWAAQLRTNTTAHTEVQSVASGTTGWIRLTVVYDGANLKLYAGAAAAVSLPHTAMTTGVTTTPLQLGRIWWTGSWVDPFHGRIDEVRTYRRALTAAEVAAL